MKKLFTILSFTTAVFMKAQPVLMQSNLSTSGFSATINVGPTVSPGASGANQVWNFSTVTVSPVGVFNVINCATTPCNATFPSANWCYTVPGNKYHHFVASATSLEQIGKDIPANCSGGINYTPNPITRLVFPFNYTNSFTDVYTDIAAVSGTINGVYDGYGTLITPFGTYNNVARISYSGSASSTTFLNTNPIYQIMTIDANGNTVVLSNVTTGINEQSIDNGISLYPNPAKNTFIIKNNNLIQTELEMFDLLGKIVSKKQTLGSNQNTEINIRELDKGMYYIRYSNAFGNNSVSKLIVE